MLRAVALTAVLMAAIIPLVMMLDNSAARPALSPTQLAAAEARLEKLCGGRLWQNPRWHSPIVDSRGRTRIRVTFDLADQKGDATIVLLGDSVIALIVNPAGDTSGVDDWLRLAEEYPR